MGEYRALSSYGGDSARDYDLLRFTSWRGRLVDHLEWRLVRRGLQRLGWRPQTRATVLDVPIGTGRIAARLSRSGADVVGVDASADMLTKAREKGSAAGFILARAESIPVPDRAADFVVSLRLFGHLPREAKLEALRQFARVGEGCVVCFAADTPWLRSRRRRQARRGRRLDVWHPMSDRDARRLAGEAGLRVVSLLRMFGPVSETRALVLVPLDPGEA